MLNSKSEELVYARRLIHENKFMESLNIVKKLEEEGELTDEEQLTIHILKGRIYAIFQQYDNASKEGEHAYRISKELGNKSSTIDALLLQTYIVFIGKYDEALDLAIEGEELLNSLESESSLNLSGKRAGLLNMKAWGYYFKGDYNLALEQARHSLVLREKIGIKHNIAYTLLTIGWIFNRMGELNTALEYSMKCLWLFEELDNQRGISTGLGLKASIYYSMGDFDQAIKFSRKSLMIKEFSTRERANVLHVLGSVYQIRGELEQALEYYKQAVELAEKEHLDDLALLSSLNIGITYRMKGEYNMAIETLERILESSEKIGYALVQSRSLLNLVHINIDKTFLESAEKYLSRLRELSNQKEEIFDVYSIAKALVLKTSRESNNLKEAENVLSKIAEDEMIDPQLFVLALISLCDLFLDELNSTNDSEVLNKIQPIISRLYKIAERQHSHLWLAETKLLQAKLALVQMNIEEAKKLLTQSQRIAELHGLNMLAMKISSEHDNLLKQIDIWDKLKTENAPMSERVKLASLQGVMDRMQGRSTIEPPKSDPEVPVLILIIVEGGIPIFSHPFGEELSFEDDVVSSFLTAFNTFSAELFSKGIDRAKFGEYNLLMDSIESFSICYLFKGQTYMAKQKLSQFTDHIQSNKSIWEPLNRSSKTSETLEIKDIPSLESLISEVFSS